MRILIGIYFWPLFIFWTVWLYCRVLFRVAKMRLRGVKDSRPVHDIATIWGRSAFKFTPGWKITVEGQQYLPQPNQPMVIVANHESLSDIWAMYYLGVQFRWLSKVEVFQMPFIGRVMQLADYVPVHRGNKNSHLDAMKKSADRLREGLCMFFFPEGTRSKDGKIKEFKSGAFRLARDTQTAVLPVAIHGAGDLMRKGSLLPNVAHVKVEVLPAVPPPGKDEDLNAYAAAVREKIIEAHNRLLA